MNRTFLILLLCVIGVLAAGAYLLRRENGGEIRASVSVVEAMGGDTTGYFRADAVRPFVFPEDYGPHPGYKTEWWYYTGNLDTEDGRHFGYQLTFFRIALKPPEAVRTARASDWAADQLYMGHFALTDAAAGRFYAFERFSRGAMGLAGAQAAPYRVWLEDWSVEGEGTQAFPVRVRAEQDGVAVDFTLDAEKPVVLQGDRGLDPKGPEPGNASYYYSFTRMTTRGTLAVGGQTYAVRGLSWKDHEWSTSALGEGLEGWDWFSLQLTDGRDLMYYQLRRRDGTASPFTGGTLVRPDGSTRHLRFDDVTLDVLDTWASPKDDALYPARWRLRLPAEDLDFTVTPYLADQELDVSVRYWEGAVRVEGTSRGEAVAGSGYVELTGYSREEERALPGDGETQGTTRAR